MYKKDITQVHLGSSCNSKDPMFPEQNESHFHIYDYATIFSYDFLC